MTKPICFFYLNLQYSDQGFSIDLDIGHTSFATLEGPTSLCGVASLAARSDYVLALHRPHHSLLAVDYAISGRAKGARVARRTGVKNPIALIKSYQDPNKLYSVVSVVECHHDASELPWACVKWSANAISLHHGSDRRRVVRVSRRDVTACDYIPGVFLSGMLSIKENECCIGSLR